MNRYIDDRIFVFDIDGTLVGRNGALKPNVDKLFQSIFASFAKPRIMFVSGGDTMKVDYSINIIEKDAGVDLSKSIRVSHAGGRILDENRQKIIPDKYFPYELVKEILERIFSIDKYFYVVFCTSEGNFFIDMKSLEPESKWIPADEIKRLLYEFGSKLGANVVSPEEMKQIILDKKVRSMWVFNEHHQFNTIANDLIEDLCSQYPGFTIATSFFLDLTMSEKSLAIKTVFPNDLNKIVYFGDDKNDELSLLNGKNGVFCGSIAVGKSLVALQNGDLAVPYFNQFAIDYALNKLDNNSLSEIELDGKIYKIKGNNLEETIKLNNEFTIKNFVKK